MRRRCARLWAKLWTLSTGDGVGAVVDERVGDRVDGVLQARVGRAGWWPHASGAQVVGRAALRMFFFRGRARLGRVGDGVDGVVDDAVDDNVGDDVDNGVDDVVDDVVDGDVGNVVDNVWTSLWTPVWTLCGRSFASCPLGVDVVWTMCGRCVDDVWTLLPVGP